MARKARIVVDQAAIDALESDPRVLAAIDKQVNPAVIARMKHRAPKDTGAGAESIHAEPDPDQPGFRIGWDPDHFYMSFAELGTEHQPARPFARPTADEFNSR
jgi:HK97 gp10 family phage protein